MYSFIIYSSGSAGVTSCLAWSSLNACQRYYCLLIKMFGNNDLIVTKAAPQRIYRPAHAGKERYLQSEMVCPNPKLIINWYFPVRSSSLSEVTLIFIHRSRLCVNFRDLFKSALNGAQTLQQSRLWGWRRVVFEGGNYTSSRSAPCQCADSHLGAISSKWKVFFSHCFYHRAEWTRPAEPGR